LEWGWVLGGKRGGGGGGREFILRWSWSVFIYGGGKKSNKKIQIIKEI